MADLGVILRRSLLPLFLFCLFAVSATSALAEKRVALIIGNNSYHHVPHLKNPTNDANAVAILFKDSGFEVVETRQNLGINDMRRAVRDFSDTARDADIAVVYFAGHGLEVNGSNYLVPVDAALERDIDVEDETVSLERVLSMLEPTKRLRLVILDACRDNPFAKTMKRTLASRAIGRGLARVEPVTSDTLIAFAAKAGSVAADGKGIHSPFTAALLQHIATPGLDLRIAFGRVRDEVLKSTANKQEPFVYGSLGGTNVALVPALGDVDPKSRLSSMAGVTSQMHRNYELAAQVGTKEAWDSFLANHPVGFYADLARANRSKLGTAYPVVEKPHEERPVTEKRTPLKDSKKVAFSSSEVRCCVEYQRIYKTGNEAGCRTVGMVASGHNYCKLVRSFRARQ